MQGRPSLNGVNLNLQKHHLSYKIGKIAPFSKTVFSGVKYNKISYGLPLKKFVRWLTK